MSRKPDYENKPLGVRVWRWTETPEGTLAKHPEWEAGLRVWVIQGDVGVFSPIFTHWYVGVIHLREIPGTKPPYRAFPGAAYELMSIAIDPTFPHDIIDIYDQRIQDPAMEAKTPNVPLCKPGDLAYQWAGTTDEEAVEVGESFIRAALAGEPIDRPVDDTRFIYDLYWQKLLDGTVEHYVTGHRAIPGSGLA